MAGFLVDAPTLLVVRERLGRLHDRLLAMPAVVSGCDGLLGGPGLEDELHGFSSRWQLGVAGIGGEIAGVMRRLVAAAEAYRRVENRLVGSGTTIVGPVPGRQRPSGSGTTVIGGPPLPAHRRSGSGTTVIGGPPPPAHRRSGSGTVIGGSPSSARRTSGSGTTVVG